MKDVIIPFGLIIFIGLFIYAIIHSGRKQRESKSNIFRGFAENSGFSYLIEDDGKAQEFAHDFDGIGQFSSPSLGKVIPKDVVIGKLNGLDAILFRHSIRFSEGWAREWIVAGVTIGKTIAEKCAIQFCTARADKSTMYLPDPVMKELKIGSFNMVVRAIRPSSAGDILNDGVLKQLAERAENLSFRPEIQIRGNRLAVYLADRNASLDDIGELLSLLDFAKSIAIA